MNNFIVFMGMMGGVFLLPVFAQTFLGYNATETGFLFMPMAAAIMLASPIGGALTGKVQPRYVIAVSTLIAAVGLYLFSFMDARSTAFDIMIPLSVMAFGIGFGMAQRTNIIASIVPDHEVGIASSILALARNIAGAVGIAVFSTILSDSTKSKAAAIAHNVTVTGHSMVAYKEAVSLVILKSEVSSYATVFMTAAAVLLVGAISALWIKVEKEKVGDTEVFIE
jgi:DHA2 family multidrug resistance protein